MYILLTGKIALALEHTKLMPAFTFVHMVNTDTSISARYKCEITCSYVHSKELRKWSILPICNYILPNGHILSGHNASYPFVEVGYT